jgi:protein-disulfide isomerase
MKIASFFLLSLSVVGSTAFAQTKAMPSAAAAPSVDKVKLEAYLRNLELWPPQVTVTMGDPKPSPDLPGFNTIAVHLAYNGATLDQSYFLTADGQKLFKGEVYDTKKNPFQGNVDKIKLDQQPSFGAPVGAPITIAVFGDFECPYCKEESTVLRQNIPMTYGDKVRVYFLDFPLDSIHPWAHVASMAGRCVLKQGGDNFWKYHDWIYGDQTSVTVENFNAKLMEWAGKSGIDSVQLGRCVESKVTEPEVARTQDMGHSLGVDGTPTLYLNGRKLMDQMAQWPTLQQLIKLELDHQAELAKADEKCCTVEIPRVGGK